MMGGLKEGNEDAKDCIWKVFLSKFAQKLFTLPSSIVCSHVAPLLTSALCFFLHDSLMVANTGCGNMCLILAVGTQTQIPLKTIWTRFPKLCFMLASHHANGFSFSIHSF